MNKELPRWGTPHHVHGDDGSAFKSDTERRLQDSKSTRENEMAEIIVHLAAREAEDESIRNSFRLSPRGRKEKPDSPENTESEITGSESDGIAHRVTLQGNASGANPSNEKKRAKAFLSKVADQRLCVNSITIGNEFVEQSYQDSCATHNFLSQKYSDELVRLGYQRYKCPPMDVEQGTILENPTNKVHLLRLTMISPKGDIVTWDNCLFLVADAGADVLIGNPILEIGNIMKYVPPDGYKETLKSQISLYREEPVISDLEARKITRRIRTYEYPKPSEIKPMRSLQIKVPDPGYMVYNHNPRERDAEVHEENRVRFRLPEEPPQEIPFWASLPDNKKRKEPEHEGNLPPPSLELQDVRTKDRPGGMVLRTAAENDQRKQLRQQAIQEAKEIKEKANMETKWGRDPPKPQEIIQALEILKELHENPPEKIFKHEDLEEVRMKLSKHRPEWARTLSKAHIEEVYDSETKAILEDLLDNRFRESVFVKSLKIPCDLKQFEIPQKDGYDDWAPPQPINYKCPAMANVVNKWQDSLADDELIRVSNAYRPARVMVAHKEGRDDRVCVDFRNRNLRSIVPVFPMPQIHDHLDEAVGFKFYCSFDCSKMFNQFEIMDQYRHLAAFMTHRGVYEPSRILFGLQGGPQHAVRELTTAMLGDPLTNGIMYTQWAIEQNLAGEDPPYEIDPSLKVVKGSRLRPFVDDVKMMSNHLKGMIKLVNLFLTFCENHRLILSRKKAKLCVTHLKLLGMVVSERGKHLDPDRIISLLDAPLPRSREGLHSLLCSYNFVRMFVPNFASIAAPLYNACKGIVWKGPDSGKSKGTRVVDPDFAWTDTMSRAYEQLKDTLLGAPILVAPDWGRPLFLSVDASLKGEGWCLWQLIPVPSGSGKLIPVAILYGSTKYTSTEAAWEVTRQEVSAMRSAIVDVQDYVYGQHFYLFSDHRNLSYMHNSVNRAVIRIRHFLSQFNMTVIHCPGIWNNPADGVSRIEGPMIAPIKYVPTIIELQEYAEIGVSGLAETATLLENSFSISRATSMGPNGTLSMCPDHTDTVMTVNRERKSIQQPKPAPVPGPEPESPCSDPEQHPSLWPEPEVAADNACNDARVLLTKSETHDEGLCPYTNCLLCYSEELAQEDLVERVHPPTCFFTQTPSMLLQSVKDIKTDYQDVIIAVLSSLSCQALPLKEEALEQYYEEARLWNDQFLTKLPKLRPSEVDEELQVDIIDLENADWCGPVDRDTAKVFLARGSNKKKQHERNLKAITKTGLYSVEQAEKALRISCREKETLEEDIILAVNWLAQNALNLAVLPARDRDPLEYGTLDTQTTPADFRSVTIRFPMQSDFIAIHNNESGHHGVDYSFRKLLKQCGSKWANERGAATRIRMQLKRFIDECPICQKVRGLHCKISAKHSFIVSRPFLEASYDFIVFDKPDANEKRYILVFIDNFTKLVEIKATKNRDAATVARFLICIKARYGPVARLRSDKAGEFIGLVITKLNESSGTETCPCIAYHPQANSVCERQNAIVMYHLRCLCYGCKLGPETAKTWSDLLPFIFSIVNSTPKLPLTISPLSMIYGVFANYDRPLIRSEFLAQGATSTPLDYFEALCQWQVELLELAETIQEEHLSKLAVKYQLEESTERSFNEGDFVLQLKDATGMRGKSLGRWMGPKLVAQRRNNDSTHPVLDLIDLTTMKVTEASIEDCRVFSTGWFEEETIMQELTKIASLDKEEYEVEKILDHRPAGEDRANRTPISQYFFLVKWKDFPDSENTWNSYNSLKENCTAPLGAYSDLHPGLKIPNESQPAIPLHKRVRRH